MQLQHLRNYFYSSWAACCSTLILQLLESKIGQWNLYVLEKKLKVCQANLLLCVKLREIVFCLQIKKKNNSWGIKMSLFKEE